MELTLTTAFFLLAVTASSAVEVGDWSGAHQITGTISFPTPNNVVIEDFNYDGGGVEVFVYYYATGHPVGARSGGVELPVPGGGSDGRLLLRRYTNERLDVPLPSGVTACDIGSLAVWCRPFQINFAVIAIPRSIFVNDGVGECQLVGGPSTEVPTAPNTEVPTEPSTEDPVSSTEVPSTVLPSTAVPSTAVPTVPPGSFENCEAFSDTLQVSWTVDSQNNEVDFRFCGCRSTNPGVNQYMAFGLSGRSGSTFMIGADATVAWVDSATGMPNAVDYFLTQRVQCRGGEGACPDDRVTRNGRLCTNDVRSDSISGGIEESNQQCVSFSRPFTTGDECDTVITPTNMNQHIVWAIGGLGETAFIHFSRANGDSNPVHLGREPLDRCGSTPISCASCPVFIGKTLTLPENATLSVRIGPSANERGYMGITGQVGWGIAWYIDGMLIPELVVTRGRTYTFVIEGGTDPSNFARYHPFYITNSINGGRLQNSQEMRANETVYAGFDEEDNPTAVGRFCEYVESENAGRIRDTCGPFDDYLAAVTAGSPQCDSGPPGMLTWTPDDNTPDEVYFQCATHLNLGWRITVTAALSETPETPQPNTNSGPSFAPVTGNPTAGSSKFPTFAPVTGNPTAGSSKFGAVLLPTLFLFMVVSLYLMM